MSETRLDLVAFAYDHASSGCGWMRIAGAATGSFAIPAQIAARSPVERWARPGGMLGAPGQGMLMPSVDRYMTREPYSVGSTASLHHARGLMRRHEIRHLPVVDDDKLVGMIADRDIAMIEALPGIDLGHVEVARVMSPPIDVWGETPLDEVSDLMTQRRSDCVVVRGGHGLEGIFTAIDALGALSDLLRRATS